MNIQSSRISQQQPPTKPSPPQNQDPQQPQDPKESYIPTGAAVVGAAAGSLLGYYAGGTAGAYVGFLLTPIESGLGDAIVNAAFGGVVGATIGIAAFGTALGVGAYMAAEHLINPE